VVDGWVVVDFAPATMTTLKSAIGARTTVDHTIQR
jgi:hypothetical protein